jgi:putative YhdH/YhfP family quinone oxidoreductase
MTTFRALVVSESPDGTYHLHLAERAIADLSDGDVLIRVHYSSLNYKDALSATGNKGVTRHYPHTPGVDAAGVVESSQSEAFQVGDEVLVTGFDLGMNTAGGFGEYIRVPHSWVIPCPAPLSLFESMAYGTAGLTAALCIHKLQHNGITPDRGSIIVTGATGGVGSLAIALLAKLGYRVLAVTGKPDSRQYLLDLGAADILSRDAVNDTSGKPLLKGQYAGAIDTVGGTILATVLKSLSYGGAVAACGLVNSSELVTTVYPFILRGVSLLGVDSAECDRSLRLELWHKLATEWKLDCLTSLTTEISLSDVPETIQTMLSGRITGRIVVNVGDRSL